MATVLDFIPNGNGVVTNYAMRSMQGVSNSHSLTADALPTFHLGANTVPKGRVYECFTPSLW